MKHKFCPYCGKLLSKKVIGDEGEVPYCLDCNTAVFDVMYPCVIIAVLNEKNEVCIIKQSYGKVMDVLIAGFVKLGETLESTVINEVKEEIGQDVISMEYITSFYQDKRENLMCGFLARVYEKKIIMSDELKEARFVSIDEGLDLLKNANIAYQLLVKVKELIK